MDLSFFERAGDFEWRIPKSGKMRVPAVIYADETLIRDMDDKVGEQVTNVAALPGIVKAAYAMPDAHWGYGFPIGGVAADNVEELVAAGATRVAVSSAICAAADPRAAAAELRRLLATSH